MLPAAGELRIAAALDAATLAQRRPRRPTSSSCARRLPAALFDGAPKLRAAIRHGAGLDMIPVEAATAAGVLVANVPGVNARSVAEHVFFVTMALLRRFRMMDRDLRAAGLARRARPCRRARTSCRPHARRRRRGQCRQGSHGDRPRTASASTSSPTAATRRACRTTSAFVTRRRACRREPTSSCSAVR